ncbi:15-hydroxyprostaglandin dehydrogenase [NAD(+)]-like [Periplaneta americana]|uniref:15-hydroxyprostaglandin dehydrogenase [NAD(+)]-like n=1 Tax=Periplaneta americana TaxID=6978 RepID=UPI0037E8BCDA
MDPAGKVILVTGGASGIGLAICEALLAEKVKAVVMCDINEELGQQKISELKEKYGQERAMFKKVDVRVNEQIEDAIKQTIAKFGTLDILINNAGIFDDQRWEREVDVNLNGVIRGMMLAFKYMGKNSGKTEGLVINTASITGLEPIETIPIYSAIKHGVIGLTRGFGTPLHLQRTGVRVVAICPGYTTSAIVTGAEAFLDPQWKADLDQSEVFFQEPSVVATGVLEMIRNAPHGSIWVSEDDEPIYEVLIPPRLALRKKAT